MVGPWSYRRFATAGFGCFWVSPVAVSEATLSISFACSRAFEVTSTPPSMRAISSTRSPADRSVRVVRVEEIARMLGGVEVTAKAREHAKEMLKVASDTATGETQKQPKPAVAKRR